VNSRRAGRHRSIFPCERHFTPRPRERTLALPPNRQDS